MLKFDFLLSVAQLNLIDSQSQRLRLPRINATPGKKMIQTEVFKIY